MKDEFLDFLGEYGNNGGSKAMCEAAAKGYAMLYEDAASIGEDNVSTDINAAIDQIDGEQDIEAKKAKAAELVAECLGHIDELKDAENFMTDGRYDVVKFSEAFERICGNAKMAMDFANSCDNVKPETANPASDSDDEPYEFEHDSLSY